MSLQGCNGKFSLIGFALIVSDDSNDSDLRRRASNEKILYPVPLLKFTAPQRRSFFVDLLFLIANAEPDLPNSPARWPASNHGPWYLWNKRVFDDPGGIPWPFAKAQAR